MPKHQALQMTSPLSHMSSRIRSKEYCLCRALGRIPFATAIDSCSFEVGVVGIASKLPVSKLSRMGNLPTPLQRFYRWPFLGTYIANRTMQFKCDRGLVLLKTPTVNEARKRNHKNKYRPIESGDILKLKSSSELLRKGNQSLSMLSILII
jgi:hypothetical protein